VKRAIILVAAAACGGGDPVPAAEFGRQIFENPRLSADPANTYSCSTCHAVTPADPTRLDPGYTLYDVAFRGRWWGGQEAELIDAASFCYTAFMQSESRFAADDPKAKALYEYLASISPDQPSPALPLSEVRYVLEVDRGDAARGAAVYAAACQRCHGAFGTGDGKLGDDSPTLPAAWANYATKYPGQSVSQLVIEKIRHGAFYGIGGTMPPYSLEALSDADEGALLMFFGL
jgi:thiosulfate dehydrogenase